MISTLCSAAHAALWRRRARGARRSLWRQRGRASQADQCAAGAVLPMPPARSLGRPPAAHVAHGEAHTRRRGVLRPGTGRGRVREQRCVASACLRSSATPARQPHKHLPADAQARPYQTEAAVRLSPAPQQCGEICCTNNGCAESCEVARADG